VAHYRATGALRVVDGRRPIPEVAAGLVAALDSGLAGLQTARPS
jgi:hypothetical protein